MLLKDKVVVITGSTMGIGKATALKVAEEGGKAVISGIEPEIIAVTEKEYADLGYDVLAVVCDVTKKSDVDNLMAKTVENFGKIDALVANAGICDMNHFEDIDEAHWDRIINTNLKGIYLSNFAVLPYLKKNKSGKIVNIGSDCAIEGCPYQSVYSASKFGVRGLSQSLAKEFGKYNINVNCVCPGIIETDMWEYTDQRLCDIYGWEKGDGWKNSVARIPLGRGGKPEDVGNGVVMLLSKYADYITGCSLTVGGGSVIH